MQEKIWVTDFVSKIERVENTLILKILTQETRHFFLTCFEKVALLR